MYVGEISEGKGYAKPLRAPPMKVKEICPRGNNKVVILCFLIS